MTSAVRLLLVAATSALLGTLADTAARAQSQAGLDLIKGGSTPASIQGLQILNSLNCPLLVKPANAQQQPMWIPPSQVASKNRLGCLSPADALYGPDGCPRQLCSAG